MKIEITEKQKEMLIYGLRELNNLLETSDISFYNVNDIKELMNIINV